MTNNYNPKTQEPHWQARWEEEGVYHFKDDLPKEQTFVIDTPPPTVSGVLHMGHIFSYTQADFIARYKRMRGFDVFYPMGFDDNGLPTERLVEKVKKIRAHNYIAEHGREAFVALCQDVVDEAETEFKRLFQSVALSVDWNQLYQTISPEVTALSQASFLDLIEKGEAYRDFRPSYWDWKDQTALANAEIEEQELPGIQVHIPFGIMDKKVWDVCKDAPEHPRPDFDSLEHVLVMTTRPELLGACVALMVHPDDKAKYKGKVAVSPLFNVVVPIVADDKVDKEKGTGFVMCCSWGDDMDKEWIAEHGLAWRPLIRMEGKFSLATAVTEVTDSFSFRAGRDGNNDQESSISGRNCFDWYKAYEFYRKLEGTKLIRDIKNENSAKGVALKLLEEAGLLKPSPSGRGLGEGADEQPDYNYSPKKLIQFARELRQKETNPEAYLWNILRDRNVANLKFRRQHPIPPYVADFYCHDLKLIIELDGSGHHVDDGPDKDAVRTKALSNQEYTILRYTNDIALNHVDTIIDDIIAFASAQKTRFARPHPDPLPKGEGELVVKKTQTVKCAERSGAPIEIIPTYQWFVRIIDKKEALKAKAAMCDWNPEFMKIRLNQWADNLKEDWCISRQRFFGVPFPVWYVMAQDSGGGDQGSEKVYARMEDLPVDPFASLPHGYSKVSTNDDGSIVAEKDGKQYVITPDQDVMDTWATSSISPQINARGAGLGDYKPSPRGRGLGEGGATRANVEKTPSTETLTPTLSQREREFNPKLYPADVRPQAHEIIRTWAFYTIVKSHLHNDTIPWRHLMISGWCLAADKTKMSKSKGNVVTPVELIEDKGADAVRYWASTSRLGADTAFSEDLLKIGKKLVTKLFNASNFAGQHLTKIDVPDFSAEQAVKKGLITETLDKWILTRLYTTVEKATHDFERFEYAAAREAVEEFFWKDLCDNYLELVKVRAYQDSGGGGRDSAIYTLHYCLNTLLKLFAPFVPHITEELHSTLFAKEYEAKGSIHGRNTWPVANDFIHNSASETLGVACVELLEAIRKAKSEASVSIKFPVSHMRIAKGSFNGDINDLDSILSDLKAAGSVERVELVESLAEGIATESGNFKVEITLADKEAASAAG